MRNFGWGLFALLAAILALVLTSQEGRQRKEKTLNYSVQFEALTPPAIVPMVATATPQDRHGSAFDDAHNRPAAVHGREVLTRLLCPHCAGLSQHAAEFNWSDVTEPTARTGPHGRLLLVTSNAALQTKGAAKLARIV